jgi:amidase
MQRDDLGVLIGSEAEFDELIGTDGTGYRASLKKHGLDGARIGVVRALFGNNAEVAAIMDAAIEQMEQAGAVVEDGTVADLGTITSFPSMSGFEFYDHLNRYLQSWPLDADDTRPFTYEEVQQRIRPALAGTFNTRRNNGINRYDNATYNTNTLERPGFVRTRLQAALDNTDLDGNPLGEPYDALLYPAITGVPRPGTPATGTANRLSPYSGFPALTMPAGFTEATPDRPALPVGMELLGREFDEATLLALAYGYQSVTEGTPLERQAPTTVPELPREPSRPAPPPQPAEAEPVH